MPSATRTDTDANPATSGRSSEFGVSYRLSYRGGHWILVKKQLVALDRHVLRPQSRQFVGTETILHYLHTAEPHLKQRAAALMQTRPEHPNQTFGALHDDWRETYDQDPGSEAAHSLTPSDADLVRELRAEMLLLRGSHQRLRARVAELERRLLLAPAPAIQHEKPRSAEAKAFQFDRVAATRVPEPTLHAADAPATQPSAAQPPDAANLAAAEAPPAPFANLTLPKVEDLFACITDLIGAELEPKATKDKLANLETASAGLYVSNLLDDQQQQVGAFVLETSSVATLGGTLLGIPARAIQEQLERGEPSNDMVEAASEVCNNLSGVLNRTATHCHVRTDTLRRHAPENTPWLAPNPAHVSCFTVRGGGRAWLVLR